jgi:hypothetical protein
VVRVGDIARLIFDASRADLHRRTPLRSHLEAHHGDDDSEDGDKRRNSPYRSAQVHLAHPKPDEDIDMHNQALLIVFLTRQNVSNWQLPG